MDLLRLAELKDAYRERVAASPINHLARRQCDYIAWPDQSQAKSFLHLVPGCQIVIMSPSAEGGMPHTRAPNIICLPAFYPEGRVKETLKHEMIHIDQRNRFEGWRSRVLEEGWTYVANSYEVPQEWRDRCRLNPDTCLYPFFAWEGRYIPLPLFERQDRPNLHEIEVRWLDRKTGLVSKMTPSSFAAKYGHVSTSEMEHPFELLAYRLSKL